MQKKNNYGRSNFSLNTQKWICINQTIGLNSLLLLAVIVFVFCLLNLIHILVPDMT
jgi:hypothetical protein